jgi:hypothetical protein
MAYSVAASLPSALLPQEQGRLERSLRDAALLLVGTADDRAALIRRRKQ